MMQSFVAAALLASSATAFVAPQAPARAALRPESALQGVVAPGDFKNGLTIELEDSVWKILSFQQTKTARQAAMVRTSLRNLITGTTVDQTFRISEKITTAEIDKMDAIFSFVDGENVVFLNSDSFDEIYIPGMNVPNMDMLKDGMTCNIIMWGDKIIDVQLPSSDTYEVKYTETGLKKAASTGQQKEATIESGAVIKVPLFIEIGDMIKIKCEDKEFMERVNTKK
ncbi:elongation factor P [Pelagophyceae sp. CCMP2097]|nr:elongation factor P [Pelagophyceae sp. CCMP2097]